MRDAEGLCTRLPLCCGFVCPVAVLRQGIFAPCGRKNHMQTVEIADAAAFERTLRRLAHQILENNPEPRIASQYHVPLSGRSRASSPRARTALFRICRLMDQSMEYSTAT